MFTQILNQNFSDCLNYIPLVTPAIDVHPSEATFQYIRNNPQAAQWLVDQQGDLNKTTIAGKRFLDFSLVESVDFNFFKQLVDHGFDWSAQVSGYQSKPTHFHQVVACKNPNYLEYLLEHGQIHKSHLSTEEQIKCWMDIGHLKSVPLLVEHGFDINIKDNQGYTPLLRLIKKASNENLVIIFNLGSLDISTCIRTLLENGANPLEAVMDQGIVKNAFELNTNPEIASILDEYTPST